jgi:hypothetical protein
MPPFKRFCKEKCISIHFAIVRFPEIKLQFDERYRSLMVTKRGRHREKVHRIVDRAVRSVRERGEYPSAGRVIAETPDLRSAGWDQLQQAIRVALIGQQCSTGPIHECDSTNDIVQGLRNQKRVVR